MEQDNVHATFKSQHYPTENPVLDRHGPLSGAVQVPLTMATHPLLVQPGNQEDWACLCRGTEMARTEDGVHRLESRGWRARLSANPPEHSQVWMGL